MRLGLNTLKRMTIHSGGHSSYNQDLKQPEQVETCIMEAISYIRHGVIDDQPPCVSQSIGSLMMRRNDSPISDEDRNKLKLLAKDIINTAPTRKTPTGRLRQDKRNREYRKAERQRQAMLCEFYSTSSFTDHGYGGISKVPVRVFNRLVRDLAAVAKFEDKN